MENRIKAILKAKGLRMADLANRIGMGQSNLVASLRNNPKLSTLEEICKALGVEMVELFGGKAEKGDGVVILNGETYMISKPVARTLQLPSYDDYSILRNDIKRFVKTSIKEQVIGSICGMVEDYEFFTLNYDRDNSRDADGTLYEKFILTICFGNKQTWTRQYDQLEYSEDGNLKWDIPMVISDVINDIEGYVLGQLKK
jgi:transcriptional regulator with XRE-family HTH domain